MKPAPPVINILCILTNLFFRNPSTLRSHPAKTGETSDGPLTLERSGSEHAKSVRLHPRFLRFLSPRRGTERVVKTIEEGLGEKVELPLERETEGFEKYLILKILCQRSFILFKNGKQILAIVILQHWLSILTQRITIYPSLAISNTFQASNLQALSLLQDFDICLATSTTY